MSNEVVEWSQQRGDDGGAEADARLRRRLFRRTDFRPDLAAFNVPTLIIHGTGDKTVPIDAAGRAAAKGISTATLIEYDGAPHGLLASNKHDVTRDLLSFLRG